ncbi:unnamed protein product [marine sediment metagenome]|uniref:Uncharacterized protein n=1 Tax=marine sediment metagenome TaxID=412755 RepID=X1PHI4_9ZZZZ
MGKRCKLCAKKRSLSVRGYCKECSTKLSQNTIAQLRAKSGPIFERWKTNRLAAMEKLLAAEKSLPEVTETQQPQESDLPELPDYPGENPT